MLLAKIFNKNKFAIISVCIIFFIGIIQINFFEKIPVNNGVGFDGKEYAKFVRNFEDLIINKEINTYKVNRFLPSMIVHYGLILFGLDLNDDNNIVNGFELYNLILLMICAFVWAKICDNEKIQEKNKWLGFVFLFGSFAILKLAFYDPVLTDFTGFTLGLLLLYFFLKNSSTGIIFTAILGAFVWQPVTYSAFLLFLFPRNLPVIQEKNNFLNYFTPTITCVILLGILMYTYLKQGIAAFTYYHPIDIYRYMAVYIFLIANTILFLAFIFIYIFFLFHNVSLKNIKYLFKMSFIKRFIAVLIIYIFINYIYSFYNGTTDRNLSFWDNLLFPVINSISFPLISWVGSITWYGPLMIIAAIFYKKLSIILRSFGLGFILIFIFNLFLIFCPENRAGIAIVPFIIFLVVQLMEKIDIKKTDYVLLIVITILASKFWFIIGPDIVNNIQLNLWRMNNGSSMTLREYTINGTIIFLLTIYFLITFKKHLKSPLND